jgi:hypothetical protein
VSFAEGIIHLRHDSFDVPLEIENIVEAHGIKDPRAVPGRCHKNHAAKRGSDALFFQHLFQTRTDRCRLAVQVVLIVQGGDIGPVVTEKEQGFVEPRQIVHIEGEDTHRVAEGVLYGFQAFMFDGCRKEKRRGGAHSSNPH